MIPIYQPFIAKNQKKYVNDCLDSNLLSWHSPYVKRFEDLLSEYLDSKYCLSVCNGSVSLMLILRALGVSHGDEVITQNLTYAATVSSIINVGATPVLIDSDERFQMKVSKIADAITEKTKAVMVAGLYGDCCDILKVKKLCNKYNISLIEDAAEVFGGEFKGHKLGTFGNAGSVSFFSNKVITTAEGGLVCTDDDSLFRELSLLRSQNHIGGFIHAGAGFNFRSTGLHCALGCAQFEHINEIIEKKRKIAEYYRTNLPKTIKYYTPNIISAEWMPIFILPEQISYEDFRKRMLVYKIETRPCFTPISLMPGFKYIKGSDLSNSEKIYKQGMNLPCYPDLTNMQLEYIVNCVNKVCKEL